MYPNPLFQKVCHTYDHRGVLLSDHFPPVSTIKVCSETVIFQNYKIFPFPISKNIFCCCRFQHILCFISIVFEIPVENQCFCFKIFVCFIFVSHFGFQIFLFSCSTKKGNLCFLWFFGPHKKPSKKVVQFLIPTQTG